MTITGKRCLYIKNPPSEDEVDDGFKLECFGMTFFLEGIKPGGRLTRIDKLKGDWGSMGTIDHAIVGPVVYDIRWVDQKTGFMTKRPSDK